MPSILLWRERVASSRRTVLVGLLFAAIVLLALLGGYYIAYERARAAQRGVAGDIEATAR